MLMRVPTPPLKSGKIDPFPVSSRTLEEWVKHFEDAEIIHMPSPSPDAYIQEVQAIESDIFSSMMEGEIAASVKYGEDYNKNVINTLMTEFTEKGGELKWYTEQDF